jgi:hypothetical protein
MWLESQDLGALLVYSPVAEHKWGQTGRVGHGIGLGYRERLVPAETNEMVLRPGITVTLHSAFQAPESCSPRWATRFN